MTRQNPTGSSSSTSLFFIALIPDTIFRQKVIRIKENVQENYGSGHALRSPAHITLHMPFKWRDDRFSILEKHLSDFADGRQEFMIDLENYGSFPKRVIFIKVKENEELKNLQRDLVRIAASKLKLSNAQYKGRAFHPHMTIAFRDLKPSMYQQAWEEYRTQKIRHSFEVSSFFLLIHNGKNWDIIREFRFQSE